jgi:iron complex outermembrane receptor protein
MTRLLLIFSLFIFTATYSFANNGKENTGDIKGTITTSDSKPAVAATVRLKGTKKTTLTNQEGVFVLDNILPGNYSLEISLPPSNR